MSLSLYPNGQTYIAVNAALENPNLSADEVQQIVDMQVSNELNAIERAEGIAHDLINLEAYGVAVDHAIEELKAKKAKASRIEDSIKRGILKYLQLKDQKVLEAGISKFRRSTSKRLEILDEAKVPGEYKEIRQETVIKKNEIKADVKAGKIKAEDIGVALVENDYLRFE
jgi:hypothetical protein